MSISSKSVSIFSKSNMEQEAKTSVDSFKLIAYNVNFGLMMDSEPSREAMEGVEVIKKQDAEIVCLTETTEHWAQLLESELSKKYPYQSFKQTDGWYAGGMSILSKFPYKEISWIPSKYGWFHGWLLLFETNIGNIQILNTHLRPPLGANSAVPSIFEFRRSIHERLADIQDWTSHFVKDTPSIVCGDFNESPKGYVYKGKVGAYLEETHHMKNGVQEFDPDTITWRWPLKFLTLTAQFDHIYYTTNSLHCSKGGVIMEGYSDHFPVFAIFYAKMK